MLEVESWCEGLSPIRLKSFFSGTWSFGGEQLEEQFGYFVIFREEEKKSNLFIFLVYDTKPAIALEELYSSTYLVSSIQKLSK